MNYSASIIDEAAPLKTSPAKRNLPANVVAMPGGVIPAEIVTFPKPVKREVMAEPTREEVRAEDRRLAGAGARCELPRPEARLVGHQTAQKRSHHSAQP